MEHEVPPFWEIKAQTLSGPGTVGRAGVCLGFSVGRKMRGLPWNCRFLAPAEVSLSPEARLVGPGVFVGAHPGLRNPIRKAKTPLETQVRLEWPGPQADQFHAALGIPVAGLSHGSPFT